MKRNFAMMIFLLLPAFAQAQAVNIGLEARPWFAKQSINFHDEQYSASANKTRIELSAGAVLQNTLLVKYTLTPQASFSEQANILGPFVVGQTDFGTKAEEKEAKQVNLDWSWRQDRIELVGLINFPVRPVFVGEWAHLEVNASGKKDGKDTTDSETFNRFIAAAGGQLHLTGYPDPNNWNLPRLTTDLMVVGSRELQRLEFQVMYRVRRDAAVTLGYTSESRDMGNVSIREHGPFVGGVWALP